MLGSPDGKSRNTSHLFPHCGSLFPGFLGQCPSITVGNEGSEFTASQALQRVLECGAVLPPRGQERKLMLIGRDLPKATKPGLANPAPQQPYFRTTFKTRWSSSTALGWTWPGEALSWVPLL